jgi:magnesium chelatase family protein
LSRWRPTSAPGCRGRYSLVCLIRLSTRRVIAVRQRSATPGRSGPISLLTINLSPATLPKAGSHYDIAIVAAVLAAQGVFGAEQLRRSVLLGEVGLDGRLRPVRGVLPATLAAQQAGLTRVIVPLRQAGEAQLVAGIEVFGIASITQLVAFLRGEPMPLVEPVEVMGEQATP